jgi:hypothetical protein
MFVSGFGVGENRRQEAKREKGESCEKKKAYPAKRAELH